MDVFHTTIDSIQLSFTFFFQSVYYIYTMIQFNYLFFVFTYLLQYLSSFYLSVFYLTILSPFNLRHFFVRSKLLSYVMFLTCGQQISVIYLNFQPIKSKICELLGIDIIRMISSWVLLVHVNHKFKCSMNDKFPAILVCKRLSKPRNQI